MKTLISFLGRGPAQADGGRKDYRLSRYQFCDETGKPVWNSREVKHFAHAVYEFQREANNTPFRKVVILGTSGSMWDALCDSFGAVRKDDVSATLLELSDLVDRHAATQAILDRYAEELSQANNIEIQLRLIAEAASVASQSEILNSLVECIGDNDSIWLDVTHGYRHLPMLGVAAAGIAVLAAKAKVEEISYGAFDMTHAGFTPVISLKWILRLHSVLSAASSLSNYRQLQPLIQCFPQGRVRQSLEDAAFKLDVMRIDEGSLAIRKATELLNQQHDELPLEMQVVSALILERLQQFSQLNRNLPGLIYLAERSLEADDFLRTAIYLAEAVEKAIAIGLPGDDELDSKLKTVRHWLAHAGSLKAKARNKDVRGCVSSRSNLREFLQRHIHRLRNDWRNSSNSMG